MRPIVIFSLFAGLMDATTGLALIAAPTLTCSLMGIGEPGDRFLLSFVGAFVFSVGSLYFAAARFKAHRRQIIAVTAWIRFIVGTYVLLAVSLGSQTNAWLTVAWTDLALAGFQCIWLLKTNGVDA